MEKGLYSGSDCRQFAFKLRNTRQANPFNSKPEQMGGFVTRRPTTTTKQTVASMINIIYIHPNLFIFIFYIFYFILFFVQKK